VVARRTHTPAPSFAARGHLAPFVGGTAAGRPDHGQGRVLRAVPLFERVSVAVWGSGATPSLWIWYRVQTGKHRSPPLIGRHRHSWSARRSALVTILGLHASVGQQQWDSLCWDQWWLRHGGRHPSCHSRSLDSQPLTTAAAQWQALPTASPCRWVRRHQSRLLYSCRGPSLPFSAAGRTAI